MAEVSALVDATRKRLRALHQAEMVAFRVGPTLLHRAARDLALVLLAALVLVACLEAAILPDGIELGRVVTVLREYGGCRLPRIVDDVARHGPPALGAAADLLDRLPADHAVIGVAGLRALVLAARQKALALRGAEWHRVRTRLPLPPDERLDRVVTARAEPEALRVPRAGLAAAGVAPPLAAVLAAVEHLAADLSASLLLAAACDFEGLLATEAVKRDLELAWRARALVAL